MIYTKSFHQGLPGSYKIDKIHKITLQNDFPDDCTGVTQV